MVLLAGSMMSQQVELPFTASVPSLDYCLCGMYVHVCPHGFRPCFYSFLPPPKKANWCPGQCIDWSPIQGVFLPPEIDSGSTAIIIR